MVGSHAEEVLAVFDTAPLRDAVIAAGENVADYEEQLAASNAPKP